MAPRLAIWEFGAPLALPTGRCPGYVAGGLPVAVTTDLIKAHLYLHAVLPQLEEVVRVDPAAQQVVAGWRSSIGLRVAGGPGLRLEVAAGRLHAVRRGRGLPSLGLLLLGPGAAVRMFEGGGAAPLPWIGAWRPRLIGGLRALSARLQYYLRSEREQLAADGTFPAAVAIRLGVLVYAIGVLAEAWEEGRRIAATGAVDGVAAIGIAAHPPLQISSERGRLQVARGAPRRANVSVEFADPDTAYAVLTGSLDLWTALGTGAVRLRGQLPLLDPILQLMSRVGRFL